VIVCSCHVVRDDEIRTEVRLGATSVEQVGERCRAATRCGGCARAVECLVADELARADSALPAGMRD
jgi:bacterioferritin-associated ferredoxin